ncbi:MAG TPA: hypothetical protein VH704_08875 [Casimicrobiaceae bacterium]|jgi:hypothetical protein|nr:hypothetical protein [Casimicrobiaceae bacterium]
MKIIYSALFISAAALAGETTLEQCRGIPDPTARLACYDGLPLSANVNAAESKARLPETPAQFGLTREITPSVDLASIESTIPGHFDGWYPNRRIRLANGQVWQVADATTRLYELDNPKVTIRRGLLGAYYLDLSIDNRSIRVTRVQ